MTQLSSLKEYNNNNIKEAKHLTLSCHCIHAIIKFKVKDKTRMKSIYNNIKFNDHSHIQKHQQFSHEHCRFHRKKTTDSQLFKWRKGNI